MARSDLRSHAADDADRSTARQRRPSRRRKILVVEDDDLDMKLFRDLLTENGYATVQTRDGREAVRLARRHRPDLILMDIQLPEVSGLEITVLMKHDDALKAIPIVAVTAYMHDWRPETMLEAGYAACIAKPISIADFLDTIGRLLAAARTT